jgi:hypothetical protein
MNKLSLKIGQVIELVIKREGKGKGRKTRNKRGTVISLTSRFLVIDNGNYKESFNFSDFTIGKIKSIKVIA